MVSHGGGVGGEWGFQRLAATKTLKMSISEGKFKGKKPPCDFNLRTG